MSVFKIKNECGITIIKVEQMGLVEFGRLMARIHNELPEGQGMTLDELCNKIKGVSREMIELAIQELIEDGEIYEQGKGYKLL
jgi:DNA-binding HxlR family transcriptional regulator